LQQNAFPDTPKIRKELIGTCLLLQKDGFFIGTWGNVSVRLEKGFLITPSRMDYAVMQPDDLVVVSWEGTKLRGQRLPSSEMHLHRLILQKRADLGALVHIHSPYAMTVAAAQKGIPIFTEEMSQIIGDEVRCTKYIPAGRHLDFANEASEKIGLSAAVLIANHGAVVGGRNLGEALAAAQVLEKAAYIFVHAALVGGFVKIPEELIREERHRFLYKYGKGDDENDPLSSH